MSDISSNEDEVAIESTVHKPKTDNAVDNVIEVHSSKKSPQSSQGKKSVYKDIEDHSDGDFDEEKYRQRERPVLESESDSDVESGHVIRSHVQSKRPMGSSVSVVHKGMEDKQWRRTRSRSQDRDRSRRGRDRRDRDDDRYNDRDRRMPRYQRDNGDKERRDFYSEAGNYKKSEAKTDNAG